MFKKKVIRNKDSNFYTNLIKYYPTILFIR